MAKDPDNSGRRDDPEYRVYKGGAATAAGRASTRRQGTAERPYTTYRSQPRGLIARLRGETDPELEERAERLRRDRSPGRSGPAASSGRRVGRLGRWTWKRALRWVAGAIVLWLLLSFVLFLVSAQIQSGSVPQSALNALAPGPNMLTGTDTVLVIGTDQRPPGSKEPGAFGNGVRSDTLMLWRIGGGTSRRLSIPRDTLASIPGYGQTKINAAYAYGGPALTIKTVEQYTGVKINHVIIVNLANFPKFIDAIGGIDVTTGKICSDISGGVRNGGFSLYLSSGTHHLDGRDALTLARTRENKCNLSSSDLTREQYQQKILNAIKSKLVSPSIFFDLPWASWDAPQAVRTDMGGLTLMTLFAASELGGSAPVEILPLADAQVVGSNLVYPRSLVQAKVNQLING